MDEKKMYDEIHTEYVLNAKERAEIREKYPKCYFPNPVKEPLWWGRRDKTRVLAKKAIVDQNRDNFVFSICSELYKIVYYEDIVHLVERSVGQITNFGEIQLNPRTYMDGARFRLDISFPDMKNQIKVGETVVPKIMLDSSLDFSVKLRGKIGLWMLKCSNGMGTWQSSITFAKRHIQTLLLNDLGESISAGLETFGEQIDTWKKWTEIPINPELYEGMWRILPFSKAERDRIEAMPEMGTGLIMGNAIANKGLDLWSVNSILTQFATHEVKSEKRQLSLEADIAKVMERIDLDYRKLKA
jgi:hypothetical protein